MTALYIIGGSVAYACLMFVICGVMAANRK